MAKEALIQQRNDAVFYPPTATTKWRWDGPWSNGAEWVIIGAGTPTWSLLLTSDCFSERERERWSDCWNLLVMPASSVGAEHMVCLQIKPGTGRDDKNPSASDSDAVRLARGESTTLAAWSHGVWTAHKACRDPPQALSLHLPQLYVVLFLTKPKHVSASQVTCRSERVLG